MNAYVQIPLTTGISTSNAAPRRRWVTESTSIMRGAGLASVGLLLGAVGGGLLGLALAHLGGAAPEGVLAMVAGGAGEGALGGLFTGSMIAVSAAD